MRTKAWIILVLSILVFSLVGTVTADTTSKQDVSIYAYEDKGESLFYATEGDKVDVNVESDMPVDVYIMLSNDYYSIDSGPGTDFSSAKYSNTRITSLTFSYTIPDDQSYHLVIYNPNNGTATVSYEYTDFFGARLDDALDTAEDLSWGFAWVALMIVVVIIVVIVVIVLIVYFVVKKGRPQQPYPPQQPGYPQAGYPPQQYPPGYQYPYYPPQGGQQPPQGQQPPPAQPQPKPEQK